MMMKVEQPEFRPLPLAVPARNQIARLIGIGATTIRETQPVEAEILSGKGDHLGTGGRIRHDTFDGRSDGVRFLHLGVGCMRQQHPGVLMHQQSARKPQHCQNKADQSAKPAMQEIERLQKL
ncbi:hypothetical protein SPHS6_04051 [Sphingobium sp. S6]|nr:hypothetical protein SPHS6_04051 [Sphingobium sp. S6]CAD7342462.1 hypothetical protein SPHS8_04072 [Sphingobium sp. S8]